jgi:hypothetical protein
MELNYIKCILVVMLLSGKINGQNFSLEKMNIYNYQWDGNTLIPPENWEFGPYFSFEIKVSNTYDVDLELKEIKYKVSITKECRIILENQNILIDGVGKSTPFIKKSEIIEAHKSKIMYFNFDFRDMDCDPLGIGKDPKLKPYNYKNKIEELLESLILEIKINGEYRNVEVNKKNIVYKN